MSKKICVLLMICFLMLGEVDVKAVSYSYSIGTKWDSVQDYTGNVLNAVTEYMSINNMVTNYNLQPSLSYIRSNNPNGNRIIASRLVFLNGHANFQRIYFNHLYNSDYMTGVCTGADKVDEGYTFAGLASTDMSTCRVITFAGCYTGYLESDYRSLAEKAVQKGAQTAVGWRGIIYSINPPGENWLDTYNYSLATGATVSESIRAAANDEPSDEMTTLVQVAGSPTTTVATASLETTEYVQLDNVVDMDATEFDNQIILNALYEKDSTIVLNDYKVSVNMFDPDNGDGFAVFTYYIDGEIKTDKSYICHIDNNQLSHVVNSLENEGEAQQISAYNLNKDLIEEEIIAKVNNHKENKVAKASTQSLVTLAEYKEVYFYAYKTGTLTYREYIAENNTELDVVVPQMNETEL